MAYIGTGYIPKAYIVMAYIVMVNIGVAYIVTPIQLVCHHGLVVGLHSNDSRSEYGQSQHEQNEIEYLQTQVEDLHAGVSLNTVMICACAACKCDRQEQLRF